MVGTLPPLKGISYYCFELCRALSEKVDVQFIGFRKLYPEGIYPGGVDSNINGFSHNFKEVKNIVDYNNPYTWVKASFAIRGEILHVQYWAYPLAPIYFILLLISKLRRKKLVVTVHNVLPHENKYIGWFMTLFIVLLADRLIVHCNRNLRKMIQLYPVKLNKISVIPHGPLSPLQRSNISSEEARKRLGLRPDEKIILFFGNIREYKGLDVLLHSLKIVKQHVPRCRLLIVGTPWTSFSSYEKLIKTLKLEEAIIMKLRYIPDEEVELYFMASDIVVLPYKSFESSSGIAALAINFSKPIIVTDVGGLIDFVRDKNAIARSNDPNDLAQKIVHVLSNEKLKQKLIFDSMIVKEKIAWNKIARKALKLYLQL
jgi:glycosyltransferase involved in cell wall biosynthesis